MRHANHLLTDYRRLNAITAWSLVFGATFGVLLPYILSTHLRVGLGAYGALFTIPTVLATILRGRRGSLWSVPIICGEVWIAFTLRYGLRWPHALIMDTLFGSIAAAIFALLVGQFSAMNEQQRTAKSQLQVLHDQLRASHDQLEALATIDALTEVYNHRSIQNALEIELTRSHQSGYSCTVLFCDLDHFKTLNDTFGHAAGDVALKEFATLAKRVLRPQDVFGRWGGEEFLAILPDTESTDALIIAEYLRQTVADTILPIGGGIQITCSLGIATYPHDANAQGLVEAADQALYAAKRLGRNQSRVFSDPAVTAMITSNQEGASHEATILHGMVEALVAVIATHDAYTGNHSNEVGHLTRQLALALEMTPAEAAMMEVAGRLHDLGKFAVSHTILQKPGQLTAKEWDTMRSHPVAGANILQYIPGLCDIASVVRAHHERWDGNGYPDHLAGEHIPLGARIIAVVDAYHAMTTNRSHQQARDAHWAVAELRRCAGSQFDPHIVTAFIEMLAAEDILAKAA